MSGKLRNEIKQTRPFANVQEEVVLSLMRTADQLVMPMNEALRADNLSLSQYNILRILRGARGQGLPCGEIAERMVSRDPDLTRLLDRLEKRGLVERTRGTADRRVVLTTLTADGLALLAKLDVTTQSILRKTLAHMPKERLHLLCELLEEARSGGE
ncbi:MAG TPA: MarR family transcriptional regulator [Thermoanaerobaculia bacterium]|nr:MarR family transcriptional regulator [Thermoanaerobaculia bacterium]